MNRAWRVAQDFLGSLEDRTGTRRRISVALPPKQKTIGLVSDEIQIRSIRTQMLELARIISQNSACARCYVFSKIDVTTSSIRLTDRRTVRHTRLINGDELYQFVLAFFMLRGRL